MTTLRGAPASVVERALVDRDPLPGTGGFAGAIADESTRRLSDGTVLVRDVLGRVPLFSAEGDPATWSFDPTQLDRPRRVPAGHRRDASGDTHVWRLPNPEPTGDGRVAVEAVRDAVVGAVDAVEDAPAVAFSGGLDSSILASRLDGPLYVGGFEGSHDIDAARSAAAALDRTVEVVEFDHAQLERAVPELVRATGRSNPMDLAIALPLYLVAERVAADGHDRLALGQGADELFGGYAKVANAPDDHRVDADTIRGATREVIATLPAQLERDVLTVRAAGVEPVAPLLYDTVVAAALRLPDDLLVSDGVRKVALRRAADFLPKSVRERDKKAVQYGSLVSRELDRLARQAGFKRRMDDHVGQYIESLVES